MIMEDAIHLFGKAVQSLAKDEFTACFEPKNHSQDHVYSGDNDLIGFLVHTCYWIGVIIR